MPTADRYRQLARDLDDASEDVRSSFSDTEGMWGDQVATEGPLFEVINRAFMATSTNVSMTAWRLQQLADECLERAAACDQYTRDYEAWQARSYQYDLWLLEYRQHPDSAGPAPSVGAQPQPPGPWAERG